MIPEDLIRKIKVAEMERSPEALQALCTALVRAGYSDPNLEDEHVDRIYALICAPETEEEKKQDSWVPKGQGYHYQQLGYAKDIAANAVEGVGQKKRKRVIVRLCVPTDDRVLMEWEVGDREGRLELEKKIQDLKDYRKYLKLRKALEAIEA